MKKRISKPEPENRKNTEEEKLPQKGALRGKAEEILKIQPEILQKLSAKDVETLIHELGVYQIELEMQNDELRRKQAELGHSRDRYVDLYDFSPVGYFTLNVQGLIVEANLTGARLLGIERGNLIGQPFHKFVDKESQDNFYLHSRDVMGTQGAPHPADSEPNHSAPSPRFLIF